MNESTITVRGWLGGDVDLRRAGEVPVASFRLGCTPRRYHRRTDSWSDGATQWFTVTCWRGLGENVAGSLRRGDPVVVSGRLELRSFVNQHGVEVEVLEIDAVSVGHDLARGTSRFARAVAPPAAPLEPARPAAGAAEPRATPAA